MGFSNSCPLGLGGFTHGGRGWRLRLNPTLSTHNNDISNNVLEFLGMAITLWLSLIKCKERGLINELLLILGDNTITIHWIIRSSLPKKPVYRPTILFIARKVATLVLEPHNFIVPQHLPGVMNSIVDWLSFEDEERTKHGTGKPVLNQIAYDYPPNDVVSNRILSSFFQLFPAGFKISHLSKKVISFACWAVQIFELSLMRKQREERNHMTGSGGDGATSAKILLEEKISCLREYPEIKPTSSYGPSLKCTESQASVPQAVLLENLRLRWSVALSWKPPVLWSRRCGTITGGLPSTTWKVPANLDPAQTSKT